MNFDEQKTKFILYMALIFLVCIVFFVFFGIIKETRKIQAAIASISLPEMLRIKSNSKVLENTSKKPLKKLDVFKAPKEKAQPQTATQQKQQPRITTQSVMPSNVDKEHALLL